MKIYNNRDYKSIARLRLKKLMPSRGRTTNFDVFSFFFRFILSKILIIMVLKLFNRKKNDFYWFLLKIVPVSQAQQ